MLSSQLDQNGGVHVGSYRDVSVFVPKARRTQYTGRTQTLLRYRFRSAPFSWGCDWMGYCQLSALSRRLVNFCCCLFFFLPVRNQPS